MTQNETTREIETLIPNYILYLNHESPPLPHKFTFTQLGNWRPNTTNKQKADRANLQPSLASNHVPAFLPPKQGRIGKPVGKTIATNLINLGCAATSNRFDLPCYTLIRHSALKAMALCIKHVKLLSNTAINRIAAEVYPNMCLYMQEGTG